MSKGYNKAVVMGNVTRDPELRYTVERRAWARFSVAANYSWKNKNGEFQDGVDFIPVVAWGSLGERCGKYLKKGSSVLVEGRISTRSYDANDGSGKRYVTEIVANDVIFVGNRKDSDGSSYDAPPEMGRGNAGGMPSSGGAPSFSSPFPNDDNFGKSINEKGFGGDFPMDFAEMEKDNGSAEDDIPF